MVDLRCVKAGDVVRIFPEYPYRQLHGDWLVVMQEGTKYVRVRKYDGKKHENQDWFQVRLEQAEVLFRHGE